MPTLDLVRGFPGSGKSTLAGSLAARSSVICSIDKYLAKPVGDNDIFTGSIYRDASVRLREQVIEHMKAKAPHIIVESIFHQLWEIRSYRDCAGEYEYAFDPEKNVHEPETPWARDPDGCELRTKFPLQATTWEKLFFAWEGPCTELHLSLALSPEKRRDLVRWHLALSDDPSDLIGKADRQRYLFENFTPEEIGQLAHVGFIGEPSSKSYRKSFLLEQTELGRRPPSFKPMELPVRKRTSEKLMERLKNRQKDSPNLDIDL